MYFIIHLLVSSFKLFSLIFLIISLGGCHSSKHLSQQVPIETYFADELFLDISVSEIESEQEIFRLSDNAKAFVDDVTRLNVEDTEKLSLLVMRIFDRSDLDMLYNAQANTTASETFEKAAANCMSLSIMTFAMAEHAGLATQFQVVKIPEYWTRRGGYSMLNGHINIRIKPKMQPGVYKAFDNEVVVDFDSQSRTKRFPTKLVKKERVLAMFYNNKGADYLVNNKPAQAYQYFKTAISVDPGFDGAWINLGLIYRQHDRFQLARNAYNRAIIINEENLTAWENLAVLYKYEGNQKAAADIFATVAKKREKNPFFHQMLAEIEVDNHHWDKSIAHYLDAIRLDDDQHTFYFGLAMAYFKKGELDMSSRYLKQAKRKSRDKDVSAHYANKINALNSMN